MEPKLFIALKAFIVKDGKVLIVRESSKYEDGTNAAKYDVVGGRLTPGERFDEALLREVKEETGLEIALGKPFYVNEWRPEVRGEKWQVVGVFIECEVIGGEVTLSQDYDDYQWIAPREWSKYNLIPNLKDPFTAYQLMSIGRGLDDLERRVSKTLIENSKKKK